MSRGTYSYRTKEGREKLNFAKKLKKKQDEKKYQQNQNKQRNNESEVSSKKINLKKVNLVKLRKWLKLELLLRKQEHTKHLSL